jgi:hypothetical protein
VQLSDSLRVLPQGSRVSGSDVASTIPWSPAFNAQEMLPHAARGPCRDSKSHALSVVDRLRSDVKDASAADNSGSWLGGTATVLRLVENGDSLIVRSAAAVQSVSSVSLEYSYC